MKLGKIAIFILLLAIIWSRLVGIHWGLPYPMHPDERNMASAMQTLQCNLPLFKDCLNPHFLAYGQLPIYLGFLMVKVFHFFTVHTLLQPISFDQATIALRLISALSSLATILVLYKITALFFDKSKKTDTLQSVILLLVLAFVPYGIQLSHFGTTESLLMLLYSLIIYLSLKMIESVKASKYIFFVGVTLGMAVAIKLSCAVYGFIPAIAILSQMALLLKTKKRLLVFTFKSFIIISVASVIGYLLSSPYNLITFKDFLGTMHYESAVALGNIAVFYTRQFFDSIPYYFQFVRIFPYALGIPMLFIFVGSFFALPVDKIKWWILRFAFIVPFLVFGIFFAKWSRFISMVFPVMSVFIAIGMVHLYQFLMHKFSAKVKGVIVLATLILILPGLAYISIYTHPDIRFTASKWISNNIPSNTTVLAETANVVDMPLEVPNETLNLAQKNYHGISFDFYNLDTDVSLQKNLKKDLMELEYIYVPSRRIFANHTCYRPDGSLTTNSLLSTFSYKSTRCLELAKKYPLLQVYYKDLFDTTKYRKIAEFSSYPRISLFGKTFITFPDEEAEETWSVFDHPVIRIYKKI